MGRIGWRTITALQRFLCERQNALVKKKANLKDISFEIKRGRFDDLLKQINEDICQSNPVSPDWLESILSIFVKDVLIKPIEESKNRFMVSEEAYRLSGIEMVKPKEPPAIKKKEELKVEKEIKEKEMKEEVKREPDKWKPEEEKLEVKLKEKPPKKVKDRLKTEPEKFKAGEKLEERPKEERVEKQIKEAPKGIKEGPEKEKTAEKQQEIKKEPPRPMKWIMSEEEERARAESIAQFEKGISLYYKYNYQRAIIEFQKVVDNFNKVIDVSHKARQYIEFCKDNLRKSQPC